MSKRQVGVLGVRSMIGQFLLPLLSEAGWKVVAFSRQTDCSRSPIDTREVEWRQLMLVDDPQAMPLRLTADSISHFVCLAPIWILPNYLPLFESYGVKRVVAFSSTSRFTKTTSSDPKEQSLVRELVESEELLTAWAYKNGVSSIILRPTLIYGLGLDKNISAIAGFIQRFGFFPLFKGGKGRRQPVYAGDLALACRTALEQPKEANLSYNVSGGETLTYREMVERIFSVLEKRPRFLTVPLWAFELALLALRPWPRFRNLSSAMAKRMNQDMVFDHADATRDLGFAPRSFHLSSEDLPKHKNTKR